MTDILDIVLDYCVPVEWEAVTKLDYNNKRYKLYDLSVGSNEYAHEVNDFVNGDVNIQVKKIQRVQNPFQLGKFCIRKEQKKHRGEDSEVVKYYHPLRINDLEMALEHNMDVRRYGSRHASQVSSQNPKFYKTPSLAFLSMEPCDVILICNVLGHTSEGSTTYKGSDSEYMPTYVVKVA
ncbi:uncharacterized protein LOC128985562 [Macrosteles quadrilineatus]|uniref:uncharacterized protein LOC128985562 n=1 Tax=Macrosteles quadrilineatus TaxID=74068 RepID=UPI0023E31D2E|nr:uncharacterized protein LOC128985562 [Macrosteles quadrilineatus]